MKIKNIIKLKVKFPQCDLTTDTENFYIKAGDKYILTHNSPAVICWSKFEGYPDNSICLKSFVGGAKNALSSLEDIEAKYGDRPDMATKLRYCLEIAQGIPAGEAWQGDCLYSRNDLREVEIDGTNYLTFHPNKIVYAFSEDNPTYETIKNSDFGICFHTIYKGNLEHKTQSFNVDVKRLEVPSNVYVMSPALNTEGNKDNSELPQMFERLKALEGKLLSNPDYEDLIDNSTFMSYWNTFENASLADKKQVTINPNTFIGELKEYVKGKQQAAYDKKMASLKTDAGKQKATANFEREVIELEDIIEHNKGLLTDLVNALNAAAEIKMAIWNTHKDTKQGYNTFYRHKEKGYIPANMEGISLSDQSGNIVKLVDRSTFSSVNRNTDYLSGFMHESILDEYKKIEVPDKDELYDNYINKNMSYKELMDLYQVSDGSIKNWLRQYGITKDRSLSKQNLSKTLLKRTPEQIASQQAKAKATSLERYGDENYRNPAKNIETNKNNHGGVYVSTNSPGYKQTLINKYGSLEAAYADMHEKTSKTKELRYGNKNYNNPEKTAETNMQKYGVKAPAQNKEIFSKINKPYYYEGEKFNSSWELAYYIYCKDNNINIEHEPETLPYTVGDNIYYYIPDFKIGDQLIEIKGDHFMTNSKDGLIDFYSKSSNDKEMAKYKCMVENNVKIISGNEIVPYLKYIKEKYGKDYLRSFKNTKHESLDVQSEQTSFDEALYISNDNTVWRAVRDGVIDGADMVDVQLDKNKIETISDAVVDSLHTKAEKKPRGLRVEELNEEPDWVKNTVNTVQNSDKDPAVIATKNYHKKRLKKPDKGAVVSATPGLIGESNESN